MRAPAALLAVLLLLPACSGSDEERERYVGQAEAVCARAVQVRQAVPQPTSTAELPATVDRLVAIAEEAVRGLEALEPPSEDADELRERFLLPLSQQVRDGQSYARQVRETAGRGDTTALLRLLAAAPTETRADLEFLREYGFTACVEAADTSRQLG